MLLFTDKTMRMKSHVHISLLFALLFTAAFSILSVPAKAQQDAMYTMYMFNGLAVNPAYAGSSERRAISALYRHQWTGLKGGQKTVVLVGHAPLLNDNIALGFTIANDKISVFNNLMLMGSYAYRIKIKNKARLSI